MSGRPARLRESLPPGLGHLRRGYRRPGLVLLFYFGAWAAIVASRLRVILRIASQERAVFGAVVVVLLVLGGVGVVRARRRRRLAAVAGAVGLVVALHAILHGEIGFPSFPVEGAVALATLALLPAGLLLASHASLRRLVDPPPREGMSAWALAWRAFRKKPRGMAGLTLLGLIYTVAFLCPVLADYRWDESPAGDTIVSQRLPPGSRVYVFGFKGREAYGLRFATAHDALRETESQIEATRRAIGAREAAQATPSEEGWLQHLDEQRAEIERTVQRGGGLVLYRYFEEDREGRRWWNVRPMTFDRLGKPRRGWSRDAGGIRTLHVEGRQVPYRVDLHPLGTDHEGRDLLSRIIYGSRISLSIGFLAMAVAMTLGTFFGVIAGFFGGFVDGLIMRFVDVFLAFPRLLLLLLIITVYRGAGIFVIVLVLGATGWMGVSRLVRAEVLRLKALEFIAAARAMGFSRLRIMRRHLIPNAMAPVIVAGTLMVGTTILVESALSFLGMGVQPPMPTWGNIVNEGRFKLGEAWWIATIPGLAIVVTVVSFNLAGDALRDALDPRQRL